MSKRKYVLAKTSRGYLGGEGARRFNDGPLEFNSIVDACEYAVNDGNPVGFDVYIKVGNTPDYQDAVVQWVAVKEIVEEIEYHKRNA